MSVSIIIAPAFRPLPFAILASRKRDRYTHVQRSAIGPLNGAANK
jgi:hypothetical protein